MIHTLSTAECERFFRKEIERRHPGYRHPHFDRYKRRWQPLRAVFVQAQSNEVATGATVTVTITTTAGNLLVAVARAGTGASGQTVTITDSTGGSNTWTQTASGYVSTSSSNNMGMFYSVTAAGVTSVTASWTGAISGIEDIVVLEFTNPSGGQAGVQDASVNSTVATGVSITSGSLTTNNANDVLVFDAGAASSEITWTPGSGFTIPAGAQTNRVALSYEIVSAPQSGLTTTMGVNSSTGLGSIFAGFKTGSAAVPTGSGGSGAAYVQGRIQVGSYSEFLA